MERRFTVEFGPSRSKRFGKAVAEAQRGADKCSELAPGRYRATFLLGADASAYHAKEMGWCASSQLRMYGACRFRFSYGVFPRCSLCPLFDAERAIRDVLGENPPPATVFEITLGPNLRALFRGELPDPEEDAEPDWEVPDFPPEGWGARPPGEEPPS